jgi:hypothetical protein
MVASLGQQLIGLTPRGTFTTLFEFATPAASVYQRNILSRGDYVGALLVTSTPAGLGAEMVLLRLDGTVLVHEVTTLAESDTASSVTAGIVGNAGGTFAFGFGTASAGEVWVAVADGRLLGPTSGVTLPYGGLDSPQVEPDARGRFLVLPVGASSTAAVRWLDPCSGTQKPAVLTMGPNEGVGWGAQLFGETPVEVTRGMGPLGQPSVETADGVTALGIAPIAFGILDFVPTPGGGAEALFEVAPYPPARRANDASLLVLSLPSLAESRLTLGYPGGLQVIPADSTVGAVDTSSTPAGFGVDSSGQVTMFLADPSGTAHLRATRRGSDWTPIGPAWVLATDLEDDGLASVESGGTYLVEGVPASPGGQGVSVVRPSSGTQASLPVAGQVAADGGCVLALAGASSVLVVNAVTGETTALTLPIPVKLAEDTGSVWASTWVPGDDVVLFAGGL